MVTVKPAAAERVAEICDKLNLPYGADTLAMEATEAGQYVGSAVFSLSDKLYLMYVDYTAGDDWLCDLIARAAMNYAVNRSVDGCELGMMGPLDTFVRWGYIEQPLPGQISIIALFTTCKHCRAQ